MAKKWQDDARQKQLAKRVIGKNGRWFAPGDDVKHGRVSTFDYKGCRCNKCLMAKQKASGFQSHF